MLDALLPPCCLLCRGPAGTDNLCPGCLRDLPRNAAACRGCGLPVECLADGLCGPCLQRAPAWNRVAAPLRYAFPVDVLVRMLKYRRKLAAGKALAAAMAEGWCLLDPPAGAILVPVPLHWSRLAVRGYNQAGELALHLSRRFACPLRSRHLRRVRATQTQTGLDAVTRRRNLRGAFRWRAPPLDGAHVILIDDVMTTGSTAAACVKVLNGAGAGRVDVWVAARAVD